MLRIQINPCLFRRNEETRRSFLNTLCSQLSLLSLLSAVQATLPRFGIRLIQRMRQADNENWMRPRIEYISVHSSIASFARQDDYNTLTRWYCPRRESYDRVARSLIYAVYFATCIIAGIHYLYGWWHSKLLSNASSASAARNLRTTRALFAYCFVPGTIINRPRSNGRVCKNTLGLSDSTIAIVTIYFYIWVNFER